MDLVIAGQFDDALDYLRRRIGLSNAKPLLPFFQNQFLGSQCSVPGLPNTPSQLHLLMQDGKTPRVLYSPTALQDLVMRIYFASSSEWTCCFVFQTKSRGSFQLSVRQFYNS